MQAQVLKNKIREYLDAQNFQQKDQFTDNEFIPFLRFLMQILMDLQGSNTDLSKKWFYAVLLDLSLDESEEEGVCYNLLLDTMDYVVGFHSAVAREGVLAEFIHLMQTMD